MADLPPLPPGFTLDQQPTSGSLPPLPPGFKLDQAPTQEAPKQPELPKDNAGLALRAGMSGLGDMVSLPGRLVAIADAIGKAARDHMMAAFGLHEDSPPAQAQPANLGEVAANALHLPTPTTSGEKLASAGIRGAASAAVMPAQGVPDLIRLAISGASGGTASEAARQAGAGSLGQIAAGVAGGLAPGAIEGAARVVGRSLSGAARPLTQSGQEAIAARILQDQASDPQAAAAKLESAQEIVPGSARTTGEASQDVGLLALEKGVRGRNSAAFGQRLSEQNAARQDALSSIAGTQADITAAQAARNAATGPMREAALRGEGTADIAPVHQTIDDILQSPAGKRETVSKSLEWAKQQIGDTTDPAALYEIRKDLQLAQRGKLQPSSQNAPNASTLAQARGQLGEVVNSLDDAIEQAAPGFKAYLQRYADMSKPIDQMKVIQEIQRRAQLTSADVTTGQNFLGNASFSRALDAAIAKNGKTLSSQQLQQLNAIRTDLQMGQAINSPLVKAPGSDTFQNLSIAQVLGAGPNPTHQVLQVLAKPLSWVYKAAGSDAKVNEVLANAMLDPKLASSLLKQATPTTMAQFAGQLRRNLVTSSSGTAAGIAANQSP